jgi:ubiquinone/menaquinone biosynthesis C-methylase UbiE
VRIELGGGGKPRDGFKNCDLCDTADYKIDLEKPLPFDDDSVDELYTAHCLEHVRNVTEIIREIARVCKVGAKVTIIVPHFGQEMAIGAGHVHVISEQMIAHFDEFPAHYWTGKKRLSLVETTYTPTQYFREAKRLFPCLTTEQVYRFIQNTCHEVRFVFEVRQYAS